MEQRKILFKAKKLSDGKWVYGDLFQDEGEAEISDISKVDRGMVSVDPSTVCQFTGLKDCMCNEIWEGDIIKNPEFPFEERTVTWVNHQSCFMPMDEEGCQDRDFSFLVLFKKWTVVDNKFDRKEGEK